MAFFPDQQNAVVAVANWLQRAIEEARSMLYSTIGPPESLVVTPDGEEITVENNSPLQIQVQVQDKAGNLTVQPRLNVVCKVIVTIVIHTGQ